MSSGGLSDGIARIAGELDHCVHCGFCLPACPTYVRLGDEADSPRGRLALMRAVAEDRLDAASEAFQIHIDRCLGCRACEPVCPSGVPYGRLLEAARSTARSVRQRPARLPARVFLWAMSRPWRSRLLMGLARLVRDRGVARTVARRLPRRGLPGALRRALAMLVGSTPWRPDVVAPPAASSGPSAPTDLPVPGEAPSVALLSGCVQAGLFRRVGEASRIVLEVNGYRVVEAAGQGCCGAIHAHAGALAGARRLARLNVAAFERSGADRIAVDAAGCGAALREYGHWLADDPEWAERARKIAERTHDLSVLLVERGPRPGAAVEATVAYHPPCHLEHGQGVAQAPRRMLETIPGVELTEAVGSGECCGGAGIYGITHLELGGRIGADRARALAETGADCVATGNPGCMMQVGAFLLEDGSETAVVHPVELLLASYRRAGLVDETPALRPSRTIRAPKPSAP